MLKRRQSPERGKAETAGEREPGGNQPRIDGVDGAGIPWRGGQARSDAAPHPPTDRLLDVCVSAVWYIERFLHREASVQSNHHHPLKSRLIRGWTLGDDPKITVLPAADQCDGVVVIDDNHMTGVATAQAEGRRRTIGGSHRDFCASHPYPFGNIPCPCINQPLAIPCPAVLRSHVRQPRLLLVVASSDLVPDSFKLVHVKVLGGFYPPRYRRSFARAQKERCARSRENAHGFQNGTRVELGKHLNLG